MSPTGKKYTGKLGGGNEEKEEGYCWRVMGLVMQVCFFLIFYFIFFFLFLSFFSISSLSLILPK